MQVWSPFFLSWLLIFVVTSVSSSAQPLMQESPASVSAPLTFAHGSPSIAANRPVLALGTPSGSWQLTRLPVGLRYFMRASRRTGPTVSSAASHTSLLIIWHLIGITLLARCNAWNGTIAVWSCLIDLIHSPHHESHEASIVCKVSLLLESIGVVIGYPLIGIPSYLFFQLEFQRSKSCWETNTYPLHSSRFVPSRLEVILGDDVVNFLVI